MLLVQKYLKSGKLLKDLEKDHGVKHHITNGKIGLNYDQILASNTDPIAKQCRGLILRENSFDVVACPLFRFFNLEQKEVCAKLNWHTASFYEKLDGTNIIVYFDKCQNLWHCATRGRPEADASAHDSNQTFASLVNFTINEMRTRKYPNRHFLVAADLQSLMKGANKDYTYIFELTTPFNRIVCKYLDCSLTLLAVRNNVTLQELNIHNEINSFNDFGVTVPKLYNFNNIEHMVEVIRSWNPEEHEGIVAVDDSYNRVKVKNPSYVAYNHMKDSLSTSWKGCVEVILLDKDDDVSAMMPGIIAERIALLKPLVNKLITQTQSDYDELKDEIDIKSFALQAQLRLWPAALFALKRNKTPDLKTYMLGNKKDVAKIPSTTSQTILDLLCKIDNSLYDKIRN